MSFKIDLKVFLFLVIFLITRQIKIYAILMFFALVHELAHLFMGLVLGLKPESLKIIPAGFSISFKTACVDYNTKIRNGNLLAIKQILIALAGPLTNIIIAIGFILYSYNIPDSQILNVPINLIIYSNILIFVFNMLPIYPLDGGRILKNILHINFGLKTSYKITNIFTKTTIIFLTIISSVIILMYHNVAILVVLMYLWGIFIKENKKYNLKRKMYLDL